MPRWCCATKYCSVPALICMAKGMCKIIEMQVYKDIYLHAGKLHESFPPDGGEAKEAGGKSSRILLTNQGNGDKVGVDCNIGERAEYMDRYVRVAFCKEMSTLEAAGVALEKAQAKAGPFKY